MAGRSRLVPPSTRMTRSRPQPHARSPVAHEGQASVPDARSADAASASAHSSIEAVLPVECPRSPAGGTRHREGQFVLQAPRPDATPQPERPSAGKTTPESILPLHGPRGLSLGQVVHSSRADGHED